MKTLHADEKNLPDGGHHPNGKESTFGVTPETAQEQEVLEAFISIKRNLAFGIFTNMKLE